MAKFKSGDVLIPSDSDRDYPDELKELMVEEVDRVTDKYNLVNTKGLMISFSIKNVERLWKRKVNTKLQKLIYRN